MIEFVFFSVSLISLVYASFTDLRERIVPDWLNYGLIAFGLTAWLVYGLISNSIELFFTALIVTIMAFIGGYALWKTGVWAGGDVKLFTALAALNPINYAILRDLFGINELIASIGLNGLISSSELPVFPLTLFIYSLFSIVPFGAVMSLKAVKKNKELRKELFDESKKLLISLIKLGIILVGLKEILGVLGISVIWILPLLFLIAFQKKTMNSVIVILLFIAGICFNGLNALTEIISIAVPLFAIYFLLKFFLISRKHVFSYEKKITELKEGEIIGETVVLEEGKVKIIHSLEIKKIINYFKSNKLQELLNELNPKGKIIASHRSAAGVTEEQLKELNELIEKKLIENRITVKKSAPMVPIVLIAYVLSQLIGDIIWNVFL
ncbi:MAG: prepilin peptidase [Candidatus Diapherotrites archaeon]